MLIILRINKERIQCFIDGFPQSFQEKNEFDEPYTLKDTIRKANYYYDQPKHKNEASMDCKSKDEIKFQNKVFK